HHFLDAGQRQQATEGMLGQRAAIDGKVLLGQRHAHACAGATGGYHGKQACVRGQTHGVASAGLSSTRKKGSPSRTMPRSLRAISSTASRPFFRSCTSASSKALRSLSTALSACRISTLRSRLALCRTLPSPNHSRPCRTSSTSARSASTTCLAGEFFIRNQRNLNSLRP